MQENLEKFLIPIVFEIIQEDVIFIKKFKELAPQIEDKIESFSKNPNCSCKNIIAEYIKNNYKIVKDFVLHFLNENPQVKINLDEIAKKNTRRNVRGHVFRIPKNDQAFYQFYEHIVNNNFEFSQFSINQDGDFWVIFFL